MLQRNALKFPKLLVFCSRSMTKKFSFLLGHFIKLKKLLGISKE